jgi:hypothetical protein
MRFFSFCASIVFLAEDVLVEAWRALGFGAAGAGAAGIAVLRGWLRALVAGGSGADGNGILGERPIECW